MAVSIEKLPLIADSTFWNKIKTKISTSKFGVYSDNGLIYVAMSDKAAMSPFLRDKEELFTATMSSVSKKYKVIINGQFYGLSKAGIADVLVGNDPVNPKHTQPEGLLINNGATIGGRPAPQMFHISYNPKSKTPYTFGKGIAPSSAYSAVGGCGPIIINGLAFGEINKYQVGTAGILRGQPTPENTPNLIQRSNNTFSAALKRPPYTGKTIIAYNRIQGALFVLVLPDRVSGVSLVQVRDKLLNAGFENAVFLDGSDSSLLMVDGDSLVHAGPDKNESNTIGIGFKLD